MTASATAEERSAAVLEAAGFEVLPLTRPVAAFHILAISPAGLVLVHVALGDWPSTLGPGWGVPPGWPPTTRRLVHRWADGEPFPAARAL